MLKAPAEFPFPGSEAFLDGNTDRKVRIVSILPNDLRLVSGKGVCTHAALARLSDASLPDDPLGRWYAERAEAISGEQLPTPTDDLYRDFTVFARARGVVDVRMPTRHAFGHFLSLQGHATEIRKVDGRNHRCVPLALRQMAEAA